VWWLVLVGRTSLENGFCFQYGEGALGGLEVRCDEAGSGWLSSSDRPAAAMLDPPSGQTVEEAATLFRALSHGPRLRIVLSLGQDECTPGDLSTRLTMDLTAVAHHLRQLRTAGVVRRQRRGSHVFYRIAPGVATLLDAAFALFVAPMVPGLR
jgi:ArsR family transcriptional regulator